MVDYKERLEKCTNLMIQKDLAMKLCAEIKEENKSKWYTFSALQCWGCQRFSKGNPEKSCLGADYQGCNLVNNRYSSKKTKI